MRYIESGEDIPVCEDALILFPFNDKTDRRSVRTEASVRGEKINEPVIKYGQSEKLASLREDALFFEEMALQNKKYGCHERFLFKCYELEHRSELSLKFFRSTGTPP